MILGISVAPPTRPPRAAAVTGRHPRAFGADPAFNRVKEFKVTYSVDGEVEERLFPEGSWVTLP